MYSTKEKLRILREINNPAAVEADLSLLRTVVPDDPRMVKFDLSPQRHSEEILLSLLERFTREEVVANRRKHSKRTADEQDSSSSNEETDSSETPADESVDTESSAGVNLSKNPDNNLEETEPKTPADESC